MEEVNEQTAALMLGVQMQHASATAVRALSGLVTIGPDSAYLANRAMYL